MTMTTTMTTTTTMKMNELENKSGSIVKVQMYKGELHLKIYGMRGLVGPGNW